MDKKIVILFGKPGAGKGTRLSGFLEGRDDSFQVLSVGNLLRKARKEQTELGKMAEVYMNKGVLVPDEIINKLVIDEIKQSSKHLFLDGYPRTILQAEALLNSGVLPDIVVDFYVDDSVVIQRAKDRIVCVSCGEPFTINDFKPPKVAGVCDKCGNTLTRRADDDEEVVKNRLKVYREETYPVLNFLIDNGIKTHTISTSGDLATKEFIQTMTTLIT